MSLYELMIIKLVEQFLLGNNDVPLDVMALMVYALKQQAQKKGREFNCVVLERHENPDEDELLIFLAQLKENTSKCSVIRFQAIYYDDGHWSTFDLQIEQGKFNFFLLDAADSLPHVINTMISIRHFLPDAIINYAGPGFQKDNETCAYFSLHHAFNLAKIERLHEDLSSWVLRRPLGCYPSYAEYISQLIDTEKGQIILRESVNKDTLMKVVETVKFIPVENFPPQFGSLFKTTQDIKFFKSTFAHKGYTRHNGKSLDAYIFSKMKGEENMAIEDIKTKYNKLALVCLKELGPNYQELLDSRKITAHLQASTSHIQVIKK